MNNITLGHIKYTKWPEVCDLTITPIVLVEHPILKPHIKIGCTLFRVGRFSEPNPDIKWESLVQSWCSNQSQKCSVQLCSPLEFFHLYRLYFVQHGLSTRNRQKCRKCPDMGVLVIFIHILCIYSVSIQLFYLGSVVIVIVLLLYSSSRFDSGVNVLSV